MPTDIKVWKIFASAKQFYDAMGLYQKTNDSRYEFLLPYLMTSVFTLELLLKCLKVVSGKDYMKIHDVKKLFEDLPEDYQKAILNEHRKVAQGRFEASAADKEFYEILNAICGDFINSRYLFDSDKTPEEGQESVFFDPTSLVKAVYNYLCTIEPALEEGAKILARPYN